MPLRFVLSYVAALSMAVGLAAASHAADWGTVPAISSTMGVHDGRVCVGEATRGDIGCPTYAPQIGTDGSVSASRFVGDGSGLTGVVASTADRIVSGTTSLLAVSGTGFVSLTQAGTNTGWFDPARGLVTLGVSATGAVSGSRGYFSEKVGVGTAAPSASLHVQGGIRSRQGIPTGDASNEVGYGFGADGDTGLFSPGSENAANGKLAVYTNNVERMRFATTGVGVNTSTPTTALEVSGTVSATRIQSRNGLFVGEGSLSLEVSSTTQLSPSIPGTSSQTAITVRGPLYANLVFDLPNNQPTDAIAFRHSAANDSVPDSIGFIYRGDGKVGIGGMITVTTALEVSGTVSATRFVGDGSGLTGVVASTADRIVSGTTSLLAVSGTGFVSLTQAGTNTGWFDPARGLVTLGVSATGRISASTAYFRSVDIGGTISDFGLSANSTIGAARLLAWQASPGSASAPAIGQNGNASGVFFPTLNSIAFSASGTEAIRIASSGMVGIGTSNPSHSLHVAGSINISPPYIADTYQKSLYLGTDSFGNPASVILTNGWSNRNNIVFLAERQAARYTFARQASGSILATPMMTIDGASWDSSETQFRLWPKDATVSRTSTPNVSPITGIPFVKLPETGSGYINVGGNFGIGLVTPTAPLEVSGTVSATYVKLADNDDVPCTPERYGTLRFSNGIVSICRAP